MLNFLLSFSTVRKQQLLHFSRLPSQEVVELPLPSLFCIEKSTKTSIDKQIRSKKRHITYVLLDYPSILS